jgi:hypothetical protein
VARPGLPRSACFDTGFHQRQPDVATRFGTPRALGAEGICRYGFHGHCHGKLVAIPGAVMIELVQPASYARRRFPPDVIQHVVWLYLRFTPSFRDVGVLLAKGGFNVTYETPRRGGGEVQPCLCTSAPPQPRQVHRTVASQPDGGAFGGKHMCLWRAVEDEGEVLDLLVQRRRDRKVAMRMCASCSRNAASLQPFW